MTDKELKKLVLLLDKFAHILRHGDNNDDQYTNPLGADTVNLVKNWVKDSLP